MRLIIDVAFGLIMFGSGLSINLNVLRHFRNKSKSLIIGLLIQILIAPLVAILIIYVFELDNFSAIGLMLVSITPNASKSKFITYLANGDLALSESLTSMGNILLVFFLLPVVVYYSSKTLLFETTKISGNVTVVILRLLLIVIFPIIMAQIIKKILPKYVEKISKVFDYSVAQCYIIIALAGMIIVLGNLENRFFSYGVLIASCLVLNLTMLLVGYFLPLYLGINRKKSKTIAIKASSQNSILSLALAISVVGVDMVGVPSILSGIITPLTGLLIIFYEAKS